MKVGDRWKYIYSKDYHGDVWEYQGFEDEYVLVYKTPNSIWGLGDTACWDFTDDWFEYLGNYGKSTNLTSLYDVLNDADHLDVKPGSHEKHCK